MRVRELPKKKKKLVFVRDQSHYFFYFPSPLKKDQQQLQERLHLTTISTGACDEKISDSCRNQFFVVNWPLKF